jgi:hypothetical protein
MTKKDYALIANLIAFTQDQYLKGRIEADDILPSLSRYIAEDAKLDHPRFNAEKFTQDCCI